MKLVSQQYGIEIAINYHWFCLFWIKPAYFSKHLSTIQAKFTLQKHS